MTTSTVAKNNNKTKQQHSFDSKDEEKLIFGEEPAQKPTIYGG